MAAASTQAPVLTGAHLADFLRLTRPPICAMTLLTVAAGALLASGGTPDWRIVLHALAGALLLRVGFLACAVAFLLCRSRAWAQAVLRASLLYLPALLIFRLLDGIPRG